MRLLFRSLGLGLAMLAITASADDSSPRFFTAPPGALARAKERLNAGDTALKPAFDALIASADKDLRMAPQTVMDKPENPPSGDKHDYMSQAPYFWPDPTKKDGLPYIRKDGERNPESHDAHSDAPRMSRMANAAESLALAAYFTGKDEYAEHAAKLLRTWFLDPATRMNPNFNFAQAVPGVNTGRGTGMIESR
ncbi:MAG TPA: alginate lyase family protein, partial [Chthoniobacteraceae bacterium]